MQLIRIALEERGVAAAAVMAALAMAFSTPRAGAQSNTGSSEPSEARPAPPPVAETVQTFFLTNASEQNNLNDIQTDLRNVLPKARIYGIQTQNAITIRATDEEIRTAQKLIADLDRPRKLYRLTYTITDFDGGKRLGSQHFVILAVSGERSTFKLGSRVPIVTGKSDGQPENTQVQYIDVGLSIEARVGGSPDALDLQTKIEQSSLADEKSAAAAEDPAIRQTVFEESSQLPQSKPQILGSLDLPGTTRSQEIEVLAELVR